MSRGAFNGLFGLQGCTKFRQAMHKEKPLKLLHGGIQCTVYVLAWRDR